MNISLDEQSVRKIKLIDQFRERFTAADNEKLLLPQIIVVGDQSSGKSSILEAISGIKLPRGVDTVTKCPIIIQMRKATDERKRIKYKQKEFRDISNTEEEVLHVQKTEFQNQLTNDPITLLIESPNVETLTIIDLPGLVKSKTTGHSQDIVKKTHDIAQAYMNQQNSLIICVLPANQDMCTTTTMDIAGDCNKDKSRIIGVLTKIDKIDEKEATLLPSILRNEKGTIKKGYFGLVVGDDILGMRPEDRPQTEEKIFKKLNLWNDHKQVLGLQRFTEALVKELVCLIDKTLPFLITNIGQLMEETDEELGRFSKYHGNVDLQSAYISEAIEKIELKTGEILAAGDGEIVKYNSLKTYLEEEKYLKGIQSCDTFLYFWHSIFKDLYDEFNFVFKKFFTLANAKYKEAKLEELMKRTRTENISIFSSPKVFKNIVNEVLDELNKVSLECVEKICRVMEHMIGTVLVADIEDKLQTMKTDIQNIGRHILQQQKHQVTEKLEYLFTSERSYFSQDAIVEAYDKEVSEDSSQSTAQSFGPLADKKSGSPLNPSKIATLPLQSMPKPVPDMKLPEVQLPEMDKSKYQNGAKLKDNLEKYLTNVIRRLGDVIPNFIRMSLFVNFKRSLKEQLKIRVSSQSKFPSYFNVSSVEEREIEMLKERKRGLIASKEQLDRLGIEYQHGH